VRYRATHEGNVLTMTKHLGKTRRRRKGKRGHHSLRFTYTIQAFGAITLVVGAAFGAIHFRQIQTIRTDAMVQARGAARGLADPAGKVLARREPMSVDQTFLNEEIKTLLKTHPEYATTRVLDAGGRVWGSDHFQELFTTRTLPAGADAVSAGTAPNGKPGPPRSVYEPSDGKVREIFEPVLETSAKGTERAIGWIEIAVRESAIAERIGISRFELATIALFTLLVGCAASALLIAIFVRPIQALSESVRAIGEGTMVADIGTSGNEEIDDIARAFNEGTAKFRAAQGHLMEQERLQKEMQVAQEIQQMLLPRKVPELEGFELGSLYRAAKEVGGDYYDFLTVD